MSEHVRVELAFVLFADIVGYSTQSIAGQANQAACLKRVMQEVCGLPLGAVSRGRIACDAGDGVAVVFLEMPGDVVALAAELGRGLRACGISARIGLHAGEVTRLADVNGHPSVAGSGINFAQRAMSCGDADHILVSHAAVGLAGGGDWRAHLKPLGTTPVKHGVEMELFNLSGPDFGNPCTPVAFQAPRHDPERLLARLPILDRRFVGRVRELESIKERLAAGRRLLTITGPGGMGKTSLAVQAVRDLAPQYADGVGFVACDVVNGPRELTARIAESLGLPVPTEGEPLAGLLAGRQVLLVLDCFEGLVSEAAFVGRLLAECREAQVLVTSRVLLGLSVETELSLGPMSLERSAKTEADAERLFYESAEQAGQALPAGPRTSALVREIVRHTEGVPLAIVLAAGRLRYVSLAELAKEVETRLLDTLRRKKREGDRHANLVGVIDGSFALLTEELRGLLVGLSVFRGGFDREDARAVLSDAFDVEDGIDELRDNSLLAGKTEGERMRFRPLDMVLEYIDRIASEDERRPFRVRHARHFVARAQAVEEGERAAYLWSEIGNFRRAIDHATETGDASLLLPLAQATARLFMEAGLLAEFEALATAALSAADAERDLPLLIELTGLLGGKHRRGGDWEGARRHWLQRAAYCARLGDAVQEAETWLDLADTALLLAGPDEARGYLQQYVRHEPSLPKGPVLTNGHLFRARFSIRTKDPEGARAGAAQVERALAEAPRSVDDFYAHNVLSEVYNALGDPARARDICREGIPACLAGHHYAYAGWLLVRLAESLESLGMVEETASVLSILCKIPKSVSVSLRDEVNRQREDFARRHSPDGLTDHDARLAAVDWQEAALAACGSSSG